MNDDVRARRGRDDGREHGNERRRSQPSFEERRAKARAALAEPPIVPEGTITAIVAKPRTPGRFIIEIDSRTSVTASVDMISSLALGVGARVDSRLASRLGAAALRLAVLDKALALLAFSARSTRDLMTRLKRVGAREDDISAAIERLSELGLVNDAEYARNLARSRVIGGGVSRRRIKTELYRRGVAGDIADEAIQETLQDVELDEHGSAMAAAEKRMRALRSLDRELQRRRLYAFLARRGYPHDVISKVVQSQIP